MKGGPPPIALARHPVQPIAAGTHAAGTAPDAGFWTLHVCVPSAKTRLPGFTGLRENEACAPTVRRAR